MGIGLPSELWLEAFKPRRVEPPPVLFVEFSWPWNGKRCVTCHCLHGLEATHCTHARRFA